MIVILHGKELKVGDTLESKGDAGIRVKLLEITYEYILCDIQGLPVKIRVPLGEIEENFSWTEEVPDTQAELQHYYDTVITNMCKGTTVKPWECVRYADSQRLLGLPPAFNLPKDCYEFALTVHLNRPVWVGSVLYDTATGEELRVIKLNVEGKPVVKLRDRVNVTIRGVWQDRLLWEKPVKQKTPTRFCVEKTGFKRYASVPASLAKKERIVSLLFTTSKDAAEFYEVFKNLIGEKEAQG